MGKNMSTTEEENQQILRLVQAMLGAISSNVRAVSLQLDEWITIELLLSVDASDTREDIGDIEFVFSSLQTEAVKVSVLVSVSDAPIEHCMPPGRLVFLRKEGV